METKILTSEGYCCPKCNTFALEDSLIEKGEEKFVEAPDPHITWEEIHMCSNCNTMFKIVNGA